MRVAWHEVPGNFHHYVPEGPNESSLARSAWKLPPLGGAVPSGRLIAPLVPRIFCIEFYVLRSEKR
jgi:hypothetical protein